MTGLEERSAFTWDSAAWIYSVIIAVVLVRYFMFVSNLLQEPKSAKLYYPYLAFMLANIIQLYTSWYLGKETYMDIEGSPPLFASRSMSDMIMCIQGLMIVPKDNLLDDFFDMKSWFMKIKNIFCCLDIIFLWTNESRYISLCLHGQLGNKSRISASRYTFWNHDTS
ncbi:hypothetical protein CMK18_17500 [Candidatus Poribacteria bacterium]|nr:hypothetical protein [Candidatus Poribacteria bacterium]